MAIEVSFGPADGVRVALDTVDQAFGDLPGEEDLARERKLMPNDRILTAFDGDYSVGAAASYPFNLTIRDRPEPFASWIATKRHVSFRRSTKPFAARRQAR